MKKLFTLLLLLSTVDLCSQNFLNGDFEINTANVDLINLSNTAFNSSISNCYGFGTSGNLDIITSDVYDGGAQNGHWFVGITGGETDRLSMELVGPLVAGNSYNLSFYDKAYSPFFPDSVKIGLSTVNNDLGTLIYTTNDLAVVGVWTERTFTFDAPNNGQFITIHQSGDGNNWVELDNFTLSPSTNTSSSSDSRTIKLVQNPVDDYLRLRATGTLMDANVSIFSSLGQLVFKEHFGIIEDVEMSVADLPAGFYYVYIESEDNFISTLKFIKK